ncbi:MAG: hypothetical protein A3C36_05905 [Omnitrophica WOR_2 bacterium RIFCSPHIGHO2_02_FULL_52_10]|nr:MAG: hypothetical protein A3C36_05905 [Omnitrophica WOR_2 bacterium RIFCSPHIGHO2_02_FULL_52_10]
MIKLIRGQGGRRGQGVLEYILLMAAVIVALLMFFGNGGVFRKSYNEVITIQADEMTNSAETIFEIR